MAPPELFAPPAFGVAPLDDPPAPSVPPVDGVDPSGAFVPVSLLEEQAIPKAPNKTTRKTLASIGRYSGTVWHMDLEMRQISRAARRVRFLPSAWCGSPLGRCEYRARIGNKNIKKSSLLAGTSCLALIACGGATTQSVPMPPLGFADAGRD
jgi:hypothetical protein